MIDPSINHIGYSYQIIDGIKFQQHDSYGNLYNKTRDLIEVFLKKILMLQTKLQKSQIKDSINKK